MVDLTEAQKKIFCSGTYFHGYQMHFSDLGLTIDNDTIHSEAVTIKESICDEEELVLGVNAFLFSTISTFIEVSTGNVNCCCWK